MSEAYQDNQQPPPQPQNTPNTVTDMGSLLSRLLSVDYIPQHLRDEWLIICSDDIVLSCHSDGDIKWLQNQFDLLELRTIRALPGHEYNLDVVRKITQVKMIFFARLNRSKNGFEREKETEQKVTNVNEQRPDYVHSTGFLSQVKRAISGGY